MLTNTASTDMKPERRTAAQKARRMAARLEAQHRDKVLINCCDTWQRNATAKRAPFWQGCKFRVCYVCGAPCMLARVAPAVLTAQLQPPRRWTAVRHAPHALPTCKPLRCNVHVIHSNLHLIHSKALHCNGSGCLCRRRLYTPTRQRSLQTRLCHCQ